MLIDHIYQEYLLVQIDGEGKFGPFTNMKEVYECVVKEEITDYEVKTVLSYIPF